MSAEVAGQAVSLPQRLLPWQLLHGKSSEIAFLLTTLASAASFFVATAIVFFSLDADEFAMLSGTLVLATIIGAALQLGATYGLPRLAKCDAAALSIAFRTHLLASGVLSILIVSVALMLFPEQVNVLQGAVVSAAIALHLVCDGLLRARARLALLCRLNLGLSLALLASVVSGWQLNTLSAEFFLSAVVAMKLVFVLITWQTEKVTSQSSRQSACGRRAPMGRRDMLQRSAGSSMIMTLVFTLGSLDVASLTLSGQGAAIYLGAKHFGYGIFIAVVQEGALPILIRRLLASREVSIARALSWSVGTGAIVGLGATSVAVLMGAVNGTLSTELLGVSALIGVGLLAHTMAVMMLKIRFVRGDVVLRESLLCLALIAGSSVCCLMLFSGSTILLSVNWIVVNVVVSLWSARQWYRCSALH